MTWKMELILSLNIKGGLMKIIYHCYGGTHSSVLAAALHLGIFNEKRFPSYRELLSCPYFDKVKNEDVGKIFFMGKDEKGHEVYVMGCRNAEPLVENILKEFSKIMNINFSGEVLLVSTRQSLNALLKIGGFLSRCLNLVTLGRLLLVPGCRLSYSKIWNVVMEVKKRI